MVGTVIRSERVRQRLNLIRAAKKWGVVKACERLGRGRSYYYYWMKRYRRYGIEGLKDRSRRPRRMPRLSGPIQVAAVVAMRRKTRYGKERLHEYLKDTGFDIPVSTIGKILKREGLLFKKRSWKTAKKHIKRYNLLYPGQRVQLDIKYVPYRVKGRQWYQYTVIDENTRMRYLEWHDSIWAKLSAEVLHRSKSYFKFKISSVQTDNGIEFTFNYTSQLTAQHKEPVEHLLDKYCRQNHIEHRLIPPGEKELNGKVERSHRIDDEEFYRRHRHFKSLQQLRIYGKRWLYEYNFKRKHWGVNKMTPAQFCSERLKLFPNRILK